MIPRDVEILYEKKQLVLEQQVQSSAIVSNFVAGSIQSQVSKESALSKTIRERQSGGSISFTAVYTFYGMRCCFDLVLERCLDSL